MDPRRPDQTQSERLLGRFQLSFDRNLHPMLIAGDDRRFLEANGAACLLLGRSRRDILGLSIEDLTPPESRSAVGALWAQFLDDGIQAGTYELLLPDGGRVEVDYSATAHISAGRHLWILVPQYLRDESNLGGWEEQRQSPERRAPLSAREREVLALVAGGATGLEIAAELELSPETVRTHLTNARAKLGARSRPHAVALALEGGLIKLEGLTPPD